MLALVVALVAWHELGDKAQQPGTAVLPASLPPAANGDRLIVEPDDGMAPIYSLLASPRRSLDLTMYELDDPTAESILADDAGRGVAVRVVLDHRLEAAHNLSAYDYLEARHVGVRWASSRYFVTHEKAFVIDGSRVVVMSLNLASRYYATSRDLAVVDADPVDAQAVDDVFGADFAGRPTGTPPGDDLVWSPRQSGADLVTLIDRAHESIALESEELSSRPVIDALLGAERRGVAVQIAMTYQADWLPAFNALVAAGAKISVRYGETPLYIHAKLLVTDAGTDHQSAFIGSENLSDASLFDDRELGIDLLQPTLVAQVARVIDSDVTGGQSYR